MMSGMLNKKGVNMKEENFDGYLSGTQARELITGFKNNRPKYGKVSLNVRTRVWHHQRIQDGGTGSFKDDSYSDTYFPSCAISSVKLSWKDFLSLCDEADRFSALKQKAFDERGEASNTCEYGTGISVTYHLTEYGNTYVYIGG